MSVSLAVLSKVLKTGVSGRSLAPVDPAAVWMRPWIFHLDQSSRIILGIYIPLSIAGFHFEFHWPRFKGVDVTLQFARFLEI